MELIARISKGSRMDQVYIPKNRSSFSVGSYVIIKPLEEKKTAEKLYFYNTKYTEPIKISIVNEIINIIGKLFDDYENIIITGSFLETGFNFNDIDVIILSESNADISLVEKAIEKQTGVKAHIILLKNKEFIKGLTKDPLYQMMLSRCIAKKRFVYKIKHEINYKLLDLHLLKSKALIENFDLLNGNEKYYLIRNMIAIRLYLTQKKVDVEKVDEEITKIFNLGDIKEIKQNVLKKGIFLRRYKTVYKQTFDKIMEYIKHGSE